MIWSGKLAGVDENAVKSKIKDLSIQLSVEKILKRNPNKFSSGEKQKIMLMKILIEDANIIIMDEPTANLDPSARIIFFDEIKKIHEKGKTILICTRNLDETEEKVNFVTVINKGNVVYNNKKSENKLIDIFKEYVLGGVKNEINL